MRKSLLATLVLVFCAVLAAQQSLNNDSVIKMVKAGLSDDLIVSTVNAQPGNYDTSTDAIIAMKTAGVSDKVVAAVVSRASAPAAPAAPRQQPQRLRQTQTIRRRHMIPAFT
jgi:hypothetical protein